MAPRRRWVPSRVARSQSSLGLHPAAFPTSESSPTGASSSVHVGIREQMEAIKNNDPELREAIKSTVQRMYRTNALIEDLDETQMKWYEQVLLRSRPYLEQFMNTEAPTLRSLWPSLRQEILRSIHSEFTRDQYTGFFYATRMILGLSEQELHAIHEEDNRVWETFADIPEYLRKLKELDPDMPIDPDMPPEREIVRAIEFLRENGLPGSLLGEWQRVPGAEHWVPQDRQEQEVTDASSSRALGTIRNNAVRPPPRTTAFPPRPHRFIPATPRSQITPTAATPAATAPGPAPQAQNNDDLYDPPSPRPRARQLPAPTQVVQGSPMRDPHWHPAHLRYALANAPNTTNPFYSPYAPPTPPPATTTMGPGAAPGSTMANGAGNAPYRRAHAFHSPHSIKRPIQNLEPRHGPRALSALQDRFEEEIAVYGPGAGMAPRAAAGATAGAARTMAAVVPGTAVGTVAAVGAEEGEEDGDVEEDEDEEDGEGEGDGESESEE
ncbi:hypothetical protein IQ07DRAFT_123047 [Pyrenochaeta sp. DS3sAY3a]|nr:hypothetical protein IQ07DRAFT_123047 [Pyrenochaeta sp. DS3sAY3a]